MESKTLLGIFDGYMSSQRDALTSETKIGGTATYFPALSAEQQDKIKQWTSCGVCGHPMSLLLQAFSPIPSADPTVPHNRMMYVFSCNSSVCTRQPSSSWAAFSLQVDQDDEAALGEDEEEEEEVVQVGALLPSELPPRTLPPCYVYTDDEPVREVIVPTDVEREMIRMAEENAKSDANGIGTADLEELEATVDLKDKKSDYYYEKFRTRVAREPHQVLRYHQRVPHSSSSSSNAKEQRPLFMNPEKVKRFITVPSCSECGAHLVHELQLMPTVVYYLKAKEYVLGTSGGSGTSGDDGLDFGTATVYVCSKDCALAHEGVYLRKEVVCVEESPTVRDDELDEKDGKKNLRQLMETIGDDEEEEEEAGVPES